MAAAKKRARRKNRQKYANVTQARLARQVDELTKWVHILKGMTGLGGWSYAQASRAHRPDPLGGPPPFP